MSSFFCAIYAMTRNEKVTIRNGWCHSYRLEEIKQAPKCTVYSSRLYGGKKLKNTAEKFSFNNKINWHSEIQSTVGNTIP